MSKEKSQGDDVAALTRRVDELEAQIVAVRRRHVDLLEKIRTFKEVGEVGLDQLLAERYRLDSEADTTKAKLAALVAARVEAGEYSQSQLDDCTLATTHTIIPFACDGDPMLYVTPGVMSEQTDRRCRLIQAAADVLQRAHQSRFRAFVEKAIGKQPYPFERPRWAEARRLLRAGRISEPQSGITASQREADIWQHERQTAEAADLEAAEAVEALAAGEPT